MWHHWNMMQFLLAFPLAKFVNGSEMFPRGHRTQLLVRALCGNLNTYIIYYAVREGEKKAEFRFKKPIKARSICMYLFSYSYYCISEGLLDKMCGD